MRTESHLNPKSGGTSIIQESRTSGLAKSPATGVSTRTALITSQTTIGLMEEGAEMSRTVAMRSLLEGAAPSSIVSFSDGAYQWRITRHHADAIRNAGIDWLDLSRCPQAEIVKSNSRRDVYRVRCGARDYFAKLYHPNDWFIRLKAFLRGATALHEWNVGLYAAAHGIAAVLPVATAVTGPRGAGGPGLLITEAVDDVRPLNDFWLSIQHDRHLSRLLVESLARLIARAHQCGFQHGDMHPGNILVRRVGQTGEALFVDLHDVHIARAVSLRQSIANLAQLNQWFRRHASLSMRWRFLQQYIEYRDRYAQASPFSRNHRIDPRELVIRLGARAERHANQLWSKRDRRTRRNSRYFARVKPAPGWSGHVLLESKHPTPTAHAASREYTRKQWESWLGAPLDWVDPAKVELLKDSHTATVCRATLPTEPQPVQAIVKRPLARNLWKRIEHAFGSSRNMRSWRIANMMLNRDLPVAQPLAVIERRVCGVVRVDSLGFTDFVPDSIDLEAFLARDVAPLPAQVQRRVKDRLIESLVHLLRLFHDRGFAHRDLKAPNLLVSWRPPFDGKPQLTFIDMDGISHVRRPSERQKTRAFVRLAVSLMNSPVCTRTDRLRFLMRLMSGIGRSPAGWKDDWRAMDLLVSSKQRDKEARRQWKLAHYGRE